jgi:UDP-glucose 4-epimerase
MRIVVTGATGNVGTALRDVLEEDPRVDEVVAIARRVPSPRTDGKTRWVAADLRDPDIGDHLRDAHAVVNLAWLIQPSRRPEVTWDVNVRGTANLLRTAAEVGVTAVVHASSVGAYSPVEPGTFVDESWPTHGVASSMYSREKAYAERLLDGFDREHPRVRTVRLRPAFIFQRRAASGIRRLFLGTLFPNGLARSRAVPVLPFPAGFRFQAVHADDAARAYATAAVADVAGAFNLASEPVLDAERVAEILDARPLELPFALVRAASAAGWWARLHPAEPGWIDLARGIPLLRTQWAQRELGWAPQHSATAALEELLAGLVERAGAPTPALRPDDEVSRARELARTRQGAEGR